MNNRFCGCCSLKNWCKISNIQEPAQQILIGESADADNDPWCHPNGGAGGCFLTPHNGGVNYAFLDGHVKWMMPEATVDPVFLWMMPNAADANGSGNGAYAVQHQQMSRAALAVYRRLVPN